MNDENQFPRKLNVDTNEHVQQAPIPSSQVDDTLILSTTETAELLLEFFGNTQKNIVKTFLYKKHHILTQIHVRICLSRKN